jgi:hypothetical protein
MSNQAKAHFAFAKMRQKKIWGSFHLTFLNTTNFAFIRHSHKKYAKVAKSQFIILIILLNYISGHQTVCRGTLVCREKFEMCRENILRKSNFEVFPKICLIFSYKSCLILFVNQTSH